MKKVIGKNQVIITSLAILIAVAGYLNFADVDLGSNTQILAHLLRENYGVEPLEKIQKFNDVTVYPSRYFTAYNGETGRTEITKDTCCIHHFGASWLSPTRRFKDKIKTLINRII